VHPDTVHLFFFLNFMPFQTAHGKTDTPEYPKEARPLVIIKSCHKYADRRHACRETWLTKLTCPYFFVVGDGGGAEQDSIKFDVSDAFQNIAPKLQMAIALGVHRGHTHIFICDDDTFVVPDRLLSCGFVDFRVGHSAYTGFVRPTWFYAGREHNMPYLQGSAYWLSRDAAIAVSKSKEMINGIIDDGAVGLALHGKFPLTHDHRYWPGPGCEEHPLRNNDMITTHKCLPAMMRQEYNDACHSVWGK
jgi:hypothetical protein